MTAGRSNRESRTSIRAVCALPDLACSRRTPLLVAQHRHAVVGPQSCTGKDRAVDHRSRGILTVIVPVLRRSSIGPRPPDGLFGDRALVSQPQEPRGLCSLVRRLARRPHSIRSRDFRYQGWALSTCQGLRIDTAARSGVGAVPRSPGDATNPVSQPGSQMVDQAHPPAASGCRDGASAAGAPPPRTEASAQHLPRCKRPVST
jgi:hypothetical protein